MNVLIADSSKLFQDVIAKAFKRADVFHTAAETGQEALAKLGQTQFDLICITLHLSDIDGIDLARKIRALTGYAYKPIVLLTAKEDWDIHHEALMSGVTEVFQKKDIGQLAHFAARFLHDMRLLQGHVLYVEDSVSQAAVVSQMFRQRGLSLDLATTAEAAWEAFQQHDYDLVVTDILLAGQMSGLALVNHIRRLPDDRGDVPILAITAFDDMARRIQLFHLGVNDYVIKPVVQEELIARVDNLLQNRHLSKDLKKRKTIAETAAKLSNVMVAQLDEHWRWVDVPVNFCKLLKLDKLDLISHYESDLVYADDYVQESLFRENMQINEAMDSYAMEKRYLSADHALLWVYFNVIAVRDSQQKLTGYFAYILDIGERKRIETETQLAAKVFEDSRDGIIITDSERQIILSNEAFNMMSGYSAEELLGKKADLLKSSHHDEAFYQKMWDSISEQNHWSGELLDRRKSGEIFPVWLSISAIKNRSLDSLTHYVGIYRDLSEEHSLQDKLHQFSNYDTLTGLANRTRFHELLLKEIVEAQQQQLLLAVIFIDLDLFKRINESLGHKAGDHLLKAVASRLKTFCGESDCLARLGGDEFALVYSGFSDADEAAAVVKSVLASLGEHFNIDGHSITLSASAGISLYPRDGYTSSVLLKSAETAAHHAKKTARGSFHFFTAQMALAAVENLMLETDLHDALDQSQLQLYYQAQVDMSDGRLIGWEALIRWNHPKLGMVPPGKFIPLAEDSRLIIDIGKWALRCACLQSRRWQQLGHPKVPIAVNISALQFRTADFYESVANALAEAEIEGDSLELELTESILMREEESVLSLLQSLKGLGVSLSIDDFGTGYSSLSYLKRFPVDRLKIDQAFVRDALNDPDDAAIVTAIVNMAKSLRLGVIAEGVETAQQVELLLQCGCNEAQGYYFARPALPEDEFDSKKWTPSDKS